MPIRISEAARAKVLADVRGLLEDLPCLRETKDEFESARFEGASFAVLTRVATILETGDPKVYVAIDGPQWIRDLDARWRARLVAGIV